jgi:hypothetical protein
MPEPQKPAARSGQSAPADRNARRRPRNRTPDGAKIKPNGKYYIIRRRALQGVNFLSFRKADRPVTIQTPSSGGIIFVEISLFRHCEERSDEAIQRIAPDCLFCAASAAMQNRTAKRAKRTEERQRRVAALRSQ